MSGRVVGWAFEQDCTPIAKLVLVKLADNANEEGLCWPSAPYLARHTGLSERAVRENLRKLETGGLIQIEARVTGRGQTSNIYQLNVPEEWARRSKTPPAPGAGGGVRQMQPPPEPDAGGPLRQVQGHSGTVNEPSLNLPPTQSKTSASVIDAPALRARVDDFAKAIGPKYFDAWFGDAEFSDEPPVTVYAASPCKVRWIETHYDKGLRAAFGVDVRVRLKPQSNTSERQRPEPVPITRPEPGDRQATWWVKDGAAAADAA